MHSSIRAHRNRGPSHRRRLEQKLSVYQNAVSKCTSYPLLISRYTSDEWSNMVSEWKGLNPSESWKRVIDMEDQEWKDHCSPFHTKLVTRLGFLPSSHRKFTEFGLKPLGFNSRFTWGMGGRTKPAKIKSYATAFLNHSALDGLAQVKMQPATAASLGATLALFQRHSVRSEQRVQAALNLVFSWLDGIFKEAKLQPKTIEWSDVQASAGAGAEFRVQGIPHKAEALPELKPEDWFDVSGPFLVRAGARGRLVDRDQLTDPLKQGRLVWEMDVRDIVHAERYALPLYEFMMANYVIGSSVGTSNLGRDMANIMTCHGVNLEARRCCTVDRRRYDSSIRRCDIARVLWMFRLAFGEEDESHDERWMYFLRSLSGNLILLPNGAVYNQYSGTSTGHPFVQVLQTVLTFAYTTADLILFSAEYPEGYNAFSSGYFIDEVNETAKDWTFPILKVGEGLTRDIDESMLRHVLMSYSTNTLGDDQITCCPWFLPLPDVEWFSVHGQKHWGVELSSSKSWAGWTSELPFIADFQSAPCGAYFLGAYWVHGATWRSLFDLLLKIWYPEHLGDSWWDEVVRLSSYRIQWWTNDVAVELLDKLIAYSLLQAIDEPIESLSSYWGTQRARFEHPGLDWLNPMSLITSCSENWDYLCPRSSHFEMQLLCQHEATELLRVGFQWSEREVDSGSWYH